MKSFVLLLTLLFFSAPTFAFDPFIDYSEFEEATQEEADINFFRHGRFLTVAGMAGMRGYTGNYASLNSPGGMYGIQLAFFFDLQFALQVSYTVSNHSFGFRDATTTLSGNNNTTAISFDIKYYTNSQNVTKGLGIFNPYIIGGFGQIYRETEINGTAGKQRDGSLGFNGGVGFEIPFSRNSAYIGAEGKFTYVNFSDENTFLSDTSGDPTNFRLNGDIYSLILILGVNF